MNDPAPATINRTLWFPHYSPHYEQHMRRLLRQRLLFFGCFLLSPIRSMKRESVVIVKESVSEILIYFNVLHLPGSNNSLGVRIHGGLILGCLGFKIQDKKDPTIRLECGSLQAGLGMIGVQNCEVHPNLLLM
ncbi:hypothetical protein AVEN_173041-1 [Araneus ventricosus]|uniref:Uncharacterized protein n=1 Tax=Araneus ventricosus TaxID=182803 RepID=A0A4Y2K1T3_ARAVE|nr:hypothetical protein AVEN_173041-1 [Araneus ventricosus]